MADLNANHDYYMHSHNSSLAVWAPGKRLDDSVRNKYGPPAPVPLIDSEPGTVQDDYGYTTEVWEALLASESFSSYTRNLEGLLNDNRGGSLESLGDPQHPQTSQPQQPSEAFPDAIILQLTDVQNPSPQIVEYVKKVLRICETRSSALTGARHVMKTLIDYYLSCEMQWLGHPFGLDAAAVQRLVLDGDSALRGWWVRAGQNRAYPTQEECESCRLFYLRVTLTLDAVPQSFFALAAKGTICRLMVDFSQHSTLVHTYLVRPDRVDDPGYANPYDESSDSSRQDKLLFDKFFPQSLPRLVTPPGNVFYAPVAKDNHDLARKIIDGIVHSKDDDWVLIARTVWDIRALVPLIRAIFYGTGPFVDQSGNPLSWGVKILWQLKRRHPPFWVISYVVEHIVHVLLPYTMNGHRDLPGTWTARDVALRKKVDTAMKHCPYIASNILAEAGDYYETMAEKYHWLITPKAEAVEYK
ncbi:hypothetical protein HWV62_39772 [Athelia sp. TMB]|nr:hypothetical protein HWV62_39772 [Athelia sp. TMB]